MRRELWNVILMGVCFALTLTAYQTSAFFVPKILKDIGYDKSLGSFSLATVQATLALIQFVTPNIIRKIGPKNSMRLGCSTYVFFVASLIYVKPGLLIAGSALLGFGASLFWNGQGIFLSQNSDKSNRGFHGGLFWSLQQTCLVWGSIIAYLVVPSRDDDVEVATARKLFIILSVVAAVAILFLIPLRDPNKGIPFEPSAAALLENQEFLPQDLLLSGEDDLLVQTKRDRDDHFDSDRQGVSVPTQNSEMEGIGIIGGEPGVESESEEQQTPWEYMKDTFKLVRHPCLLPLCVLFIYGGIMMSFWQGTYGTIVGGGYENLIPRPLPESFKAHLITYVMIVFGATEVLGALFFGWLCDRAGRSISMAFSCLFLLIGVALIYANFIAANHWGLWEGEPLISVALVAAGFLGLSDSAVNTIIYSVVGRVFGGTSEDDDDDEDFGAEQGGVGGLMDDAQSVNSDNLNEAEHIPAMAESGKNQLDHAYAFHFFCRACAGAAAYYYAPELELTIQLVLMAGFCSSSLVAVAWVERKLRRQREWKR